MDKLEQKLRDVTASTVEVNNRDFEEGLKLFDGQNVDVSVQKEDGVYKIFGRDQEDDPVETDLNTEKEVVAFFERQDWS